MDHLPPDLPVQAVLIWIETRNREACLEVFETADDEAAVSVKDFGLTQVAYVIATRRRAGSLTIKDKAAQFEKLGDGSVRTTFKKHSSPKDDYEFFKAEKELLQALVDGSITAYTIDTGVTPQKIDAMLWQGRVFADVVRGGRYHVVAASAGHEPLRSIRFKKDDIFQKWPPEGGQEPGFKMAEDIRQIGLLKANTAEVGGHKFKSPVPLGIGNRIPGRLETRTRYKGPVLWSASPHH